RIISNPSSHANSGFDGSILTLLCTTGIAGTFVFVKGIRKTFISSSLTVQAFWVALLVHSLFANSLLYPFTLFTLALFKSRKSE
ncbi:MAG: hypothetical protein WC686_03145, partial [Candidatus Shapirobacteria bacterium]